MTTALPNTESQVFLTVENNKGIITLNRPKALNSLNLSMINQIYPTLINNNKNLKRERLLKKDVSNKITSILRKIVTLKEGTASLANVEGYDVGGKTGTAQKSAIGGYSKDKINTFVSIFPISKPKYSLVVILDEPKINSEYIYHYRDGSGIKYKGTPFNTAGWTSVEVVGQIIEKIGPILATKYKDIN